MSKPLSFDLQHEDCTRGANDAVFLRWFLAHPQCNLKAVLDLSTALQIKELRAEIDRLLLLKVENMKYDISNSKAVDALHRLLATDGF